MAVSTTSTSITETLLRIATMASTSEPTSTATATSRTSGEPMDPAAVLLRWTRRAGDALGRFQLIEQARHLELGLGRQARPSSKSGRAPTLLADHVLWGYTVIGGDRDPLGSSRRPS
jgi:hypothetical protein